MKKKQETKAGIKETENMAGGLGSETEHDSNEKNFFGIQ